MSSDFTTTSPSAYDVSIAPLAIKILNWQPGGIAGAACCMVVHATAYLPPQRWLPLPAHPDAPGATPRLLATLAVALAVLAYMSRDPAARARRIPVRFS